MRFGLILTHNAPPLSPAIPIKDIGKTLLAKTLRELDIDRQDFDQA